MAKKTKDTRLDSRTARAKLEPRGAPNYASIGRDLHIGYRKGQTSGVWVVRRRVGKAYKVESIGTADDVHAADGHGVFDWEQARERARKLETGSAAIPEPAKPLTVAQAIERYLQYLAIHEQEGRRRPGAAKGARLRARHDILASPLACRRVNDLTVDDLRQWLRELAARPRHGRGKGGGPSRPSSPPATPTTPEEQQRRRRSSANRSLTILQAALNRAFKDGLADSDKAWRLVERFGGADAARIRYLERDECARLIDACGGAFRALVHAALLTGARYQELARLRVHDFSAVSGSLRISESKSGKSRNIILTDEATSFFSRLCDGRASDELMLPRDDGARWNPSNQKRPLLRACIAAGVAPINFHQLRHTFASLAVQDHLPLMIVAENLGHYDTTMVQKHYGHLSHDYKKQMIRELSKPLIPDGNVVVLPKQGGVR